MRILLLMPSLTGTGGAERMVDGLSRLLSSAGVEAFEASFDSPGVRRRFENSTPFHPLGPLPRLPLPFRAFEYLVAARRLRALKRRLKIDVTISNLWRSDLISVLSGGFDRKIALCHINIVENPTNRMMVRLRPVVAAVYRRCDRVVAVNEALSRELAGLYSLAADQIGFVDNFVWRPEFEPRPPRDGMKRFVWCGRMKFPRRMSREDSYMRGAPSHPPSTARNSSCSATALNVANSNVSPKNSDCARARSTTRKRRSRSRAWWRSPPAIWRAAAPWR